MKISVVLPIFNVAPYLSKCLDSLLSQTLSDIEIICVNDCSPDNSADILARYATKDPRIIVVNHKQNAGAGMARQSGVDVAQGEYIGFVDPDDYVQSDFFEKLYNAAKKNDADIAKGSIYTVALDGSRQCTSFHLNQMILMDKYRFHGQALWSAIYRKEMVRQNKIHFVIDIFCFGIQAAFYANKIIIVDDAFYNYVRRVDSCDCACFTLHKWQWWNIRGAKFYLEFLNTHDYAKSDYMTVVQDLIYPLYFYGYDRLNQTDRNTGADILTQSLIDFYHTVKYRDEVTKMMGKYCRPIINGNVKKLKKMLLRRGQKSFWKKLRFWKN